MVLVGTLHNRPVVAQDVVKQAGSTESTPPYSPPRPLSFADIVQNHDLWPKQVLLTKPTAFPVMLNQRPSGKATIPAGRSFDVLSITSEGLTVAFQGGAQLVPADSTNVMDLARRALEPPSSIQQPVSTAIASQPQATPVPVADAPRPEDATAHSHLISAKPPYTEYNEPLAQNPDSPPTRNPAYIKIAQLMAQRTGEPKPPYRPQPLNFLRSIERYEALAAPAQRAKLVKELANDLRQVAWQFENGPFVGKCFALDAALMAAEMALKSLKDKEMALAIVETFVWPNYQLAGMEGSTSSFNVENHLEKVAYFYDRCGAWNRAEVAYKTLLAFYSKRQFLNQADATRIHLSYVYREQKRYAEAVAIIKEVTDDALVSIKEDIPALKAAAEKQAQATKKKK